VSTYCEERASVPREGAVERNPSEAQKLNTLFYDDKYKAWRLKMQSIIKAE